MGMAFILIVIAVVVWFYSKHQKKKLAWMKFVVIRRQQELGKCWCNTKLYHLSDWERKAFELGIYLPDSYNIMSKLGWSERVIEFKVHELGLCYQANLDRWCYLRDTP